MKKMFLLIPNSHSNHAEKWTASKILLYKRAYALMTSRVGDDSVDRLTDIDLEMMMTSVD